MFSRTDLVCTDQRLALLSCQVINASSRLISLPFLFLFPPSEDVFVTEYRDLQLSQCLTRGLWTLLIVTLASAMSPGLLGLAVRRKPALFTGRISQILKVVLSLHPPSPQPAVELPLGPFRPRLLATLTISERTSYAAASDSTASLHHRRPPLSSRLVLSGA